jgi:hypothetical protein
LLPSPVDEHWHEYKTTITTVAERILGEMDKRRRSDWFDEECQVVTDEKNEAYKRMLQRSGTRGSTEEYRNKRREEKKVHRKKKCTYENQRINDIEGFRNKNETRRFYKLLNSERKTYKPRITMCRDVDGTILTGKTQILDRWVEHFDKILNSNGNTNEEVVVEDITEEVEEHPQPTKMK